MTSYSCIKVIHVCEIITHTHTHIRTLFTETKVDVVHIIKLNEQHFFSLHILSTHTYGFCHVC